MQKLLNFDLYQSAADLILKEVRSPLDTEFIFTAILSLRE